jgi:hypothetical protein
MTALHPGINLTETLNKLLIRISKRLFSYQMFMVARPLPTVPSLLQVAVDTSLERAVSGRASYALKTAKAMAR